MVAEINHGARASREGAEEFRYIRRDTTVAKGRLYFADVAPPVRAKAVENLLILARHHQRSGWITAYRKADSVGIRIAHVMLEG